MHITSTTSRLASFAFALAIAGTLHASVLWGFDSMAQQASTPANVATVTLPTVTVVAQRS